MSFAQRAIIWFVVIPFVHGVIPWGISTLTRRHGWHGAFPGEWNWFGLMPLTAATALLVWSLWWRQRSASAYRSESVLSPARAGERVTPPPSALLTEGPYRFTRNPVYLACLGLWLGWTLFFGSSGVLIAWFVLCVVAKFGIVPKEERDLESQFGAAYLQYKNRVPRWLGEVNGPKEEDGAAAK